MHRDPQIGGEKVHGHGWWRLVALLVAVVALIVLGRALGLGQRIANLQAWIAGLGKWGPVAFVLVAIAATVAVVPASVLTTTAGALFGSVLGVIYVTIGLVVGASLALLIARYFAREAVARWLSRYKKFHRLDELTERHGAIIVALARLIPIVPFNVINYAFGLTRVPFWTYVLWSAICMLPNTIIFVVGTDAVVKAISEGRVPWLLVAVLVVVVVALWILIQAARQKIKVRESETVEKDTCG